MGAFGDKLRREREMRGITLSEISESTKISKRWLQALEDEEFNLLPGGVFNRGFVRAYARFLGINDEQAVADYIAASNETAPPDDKFPLDVHEKKSDAPSLNPKRSFVPVLLAILALVLVVGGWTVWVKHKPQNGTVAEQKPASKTQEQSPAVTSSPSPSSPTSAQPATQPADATESQAAAEDSKQVRVEQSPNGSISVVIKAKKDSWISIVADGRTLWEGTLNASTQRSIHAGKELVLKTGNAAGIEVSYNGKPLGILGREKEVRTITFNTAGLQQ